jgi:hypothetical protein
MVHRVRKVELPGIPLASFADDTYFKLYACDVGLLRRLADIPASALLNPTPLYRDFKGALTENYALTELLAAFGAEPYFWRSGNRAEVDFVLQLGADIVPIEVKSERNTAGKSLSVYRSRYAPARWHTLSLRPALGPNVPLYLIWALPGWAGAGIAPTDSGAAGPSPPSPT